MTDATPTAAAPLTVVLVHGAFADGSSWSGVIERLQAQGVAVIAPANPLRGITHDSAYTASFINQIPGPVLAVGHSYGGAVISNAATNAKNVVGLVFVAAFAPDEGEVLGQVTATSKDAILGPALMPLQYPTGQGDETAVEFMVDPAKVHEVFAGDLPAAAAAVVGATQRPVAELGFSEPNGTAGLEDAAVMGGGGHRRQGGRHRPHPLDGRARRGHDHRGRWLARDHGLPAPGRHRRHPGGDRGGFLTAEAGRRLARWRASPRTS